MSESDRAEFKRQIEAQTVEFLDAYNRGDAQAIGKLYTAAVIALYPGSSLTHGRDEIAKGYQALMDAGVKTTGITTKQQECDGKIGYAFQVAHTDRGDVPVLLTFRKSNDGTWLACGEAVPSTPTT